MMIFIIALSSLIVGLMFGYMMFNDSPANYNYEVEIGMKKYHLKFKAKKTEIFDYYNVTFKQTVIQLKEEDK